MFLLNKGRGLFFYLLIALFVGANTTGCAKKVEGPVDLSTLKMEKVGNATIDKFFGDVDAVLKSLKAIQDNLKSTDSALTTTLGATEGQSLKEVIGGFIADAKGQLDFKIDIKQVPPTVSISAKDGAPESVTKGVNGLQTAIKGYTGVVSEAKGLQPKISSLISSSSTVVSAIADEIKKKMSAGDFGGMKELKNKTGNNLKITKALPGVALETVKSAVGSIQSIIGALKGE